ncbi:TPA: hypothetical protein EYP12_02745, partial [Candidatus Bipolaricaulota bacterium]|nr:hypothetical protein [Candidatus Bipolaricaulota bacterium]
KDIKSRFIIEIKDLDEFKKKVNFSVERKRQELKELLEGNLMRRKDKEYLAKFKEALKKGATSKELAEKFKIPYPTVKLVLRNLISAEVILRKKYGRKFIYYLPTSAELSGKPPGKIGGHSLG